MVDALVVVGGDGRALTPLEQALRESARVLDELVGWLRSAYDRA